MTQIVFEYHLHHRDRFAKIRGQSFEFDFVSSGLIMKTFSIVIICFLKLRQDDDFIYGRNINLRLQHFHLNWDTL